MKKFRSLFACLALTVGLAGAAFVTACGTGTGGTDPSASTPATSHYKADLAAGYDAVKAVRVITTIALQSHAITVAQAEAVQTQCEAFTSTLDTLRAGTATTANQTTLTATLLAIAAATAYVTATKGASTS